MKVIQLADSFYPLVGGGSVSIRMLMENMRDVEFDVVTDALPGQKSIDQYSDNVIIRRFFPASIVYSPKYKGKNKTIAFPYRIFSEWLRFNMKCNYLKRADYDILHFNGPLTNYAFFIFDQFLGYPLLTKLNDFSFVKTSKLVTLRGIRSWWTNSDVDKKNEQRVIRMFDNIICVDECIFSYVNSYISKIGKSKNVWFIHNSVDIKKFSPAPLPNEETLKVGFIGRLSVEKGKDLVFALAKNLPSYIELHMVIPGKAEEISKLRSPRIHVYPNIPYEQIPSYIHDMDLIFNPVTVEGISRVTLEVMSCGRPVIMIDKGNRYPVIHNKTGFLIEKNLDKLVQLLQVLNEDRELIKKTGKKGREIIENEFANNVVIPKIKQIYESVVENG